MWKSRSCGKETKWEEVTANKKKMKKGRKMFESEMKMKIGGISDEGGKRAECWIRV